MKSDDKKPQIKSDDKKGQTKSDDKKPQIKSDDKKPQTKSDDKKSQIKSDDKKPQIKSDDKKGQTKSDDKKGQIKLEENKTQTNEGIKMVLENTPLNEVVIGIDLGTTNTCAAILKNDKIEIIKNDADEKIIPSVVCYTENRTYVGTLAKNRRFQFPESTIFESKRLIGKKNLKT